jgi:3-phenylpropionate/trans-cinnamate dioxygenase ferredoxin subunit
MNLLKRVPIMPFIALEKSHRLHDGYCRRFRVGRTQVLLIHYQGVTHLIGDACPHAGASLKKGRIDQGCIHCPKHGLVFELASGRARGGDVVADIPSLTRYAPERRGDEIGFYTGD